MGGPRSNVADAESGGDVQSRVLLQYAACAQGFTLTALVTICSLRKAWQWYTRRTAPPSPSSTDHVRASHPRSSPWLDRLVWRLSDDAHFMAMQPCRLDEWILGTTWFSLLFLHSASNIRNLNEPFNLSRLPQHLADLQWSRLFTLPDGPALHLSKRLALVAASQWPLLPLLRMKRSSPLSYLLGCSHTRLNRYGSVLGSVMSLLLLLHVLVQLGRMDTQTLHSRGGKLRIVGYGGLYVMLSVAQKFSVRNPTWGLVALGPALLSVWLVWRHAEMARGYLLQAGVAWIATMILPMKTTAVLEKQPSPEAKAAAQAAINGPADGQGGGQPPFIVLETEHEMTSLATEKPEAETETEKKPIIVATMHTRRGRLARHLTRLWSIASSKFGINARKGMCQVEKQSMTLVYASLPTQTSTEEVRAALRFVGPLNTLGHGMDNLAHFNADHVVFIAGGILGYLAYPACLAFVAAQWKTRASSSVRVIWALNSRSGTSCAIPRRIRSTDASKYGESGHSALLCPDEELLNDGEGADAAITRRRGVASKQSCPLTGPCPHASVPELVGRLMLRNADDSVAVVVLGPEELEREARRATRPWVIRGRRVWWLFENYAQ